MADEEAKEETAKEEDDLYTAPKTRPKIIRILTVFAYMSSVSMAAILLSIYYIFMWDGQPTLARRRDPHVEPIIDYSPEILSKTDIFEHVLNEKEIATRNNSYAVSMGKEIIGNEKINETVSVKENDLTTFQPNDDTTKVGDSDRGNLKEAPKQILQEFVQPTIDLSPEVSTWNPNEEKENVETVEEDIETPSLPEPIDMNKRILPDKKFFYKQLILA